ncbi:MAG: alpha/beta fold hydrolase [Comamonas sp.]
MSLAFMLTAGLIGCSALDERQRQFIFNPAISTWGHNPEFQDVWIPFTSRLTDQPVKMHALWLGDAPALLDPQQPVALYLHGARWDVWASRARIERLHEMGFAVLAIDYRGFGKTTSGLRGASRSNTLPSESMAYEDAMAAWEWLAEKLPRNKRYIYGHSLGGAIAIDLASKVSDEAGTLVEGTFSSVRDVFATTHWGWLPVGPLLTQRFESIDKIRHIDSPLLIVHGSDDDVIKPELGERLYAAAISPKRFVMVEGGNHHNATSLGFAQYQTALRELFGIQPPTPPVVEAAADAHAALPAADAGEQSARDATQAEETDKADAPLLRQAATSAANAPRARSAATDNS